MFATPLASCLYSENGVTLGQVVDAVNNPKGEKIDDYESTLVRNSNGVYFLECIEEESRSGWTLTI